MGGTSIKYGVVEGSIVSGHGAVATPQTWPEAKQLLTKLCREHPQCKGVGLATPGVVDYPAGEIRGISAIPYIHHFPIVEELRSAFHVPLYIENDANSAGLAEVTYGVAKGHLSVAFLVIGTGVGGCTFISGHLLRGAHLYAGEFGGLFTSGQGIVTQAASPVELGKRYSRERGGSRQYSGKEVFEAAEANDNLAKRLVDDLFNALVDGVFSIANVLDPEMIVLGGALSSNRWIVQEVQRRFKQRMITNQTSDLAPVITGAEFGGEANLIGAAIAFHQYFDGAVTDLGGITS